MLLFASLPIHGPTGREACAVVDHLHKLHNPRLRVGVHATAGEGQAPAEPGADLQRSEVLLRNLKLKGTPRAKVGRFAQLPNALEQSR